MNRFKLSEWLMVILTAIITACTIIMLNLAMASEEDHHRDGIEARQYQISSER